MVEFSVLDNDGGGTVDATEVITMFYRRYGRVGALKVLSFPVCTMISLPFISYALDLPLLGSESLQIL
eukprot:SAG31_NODE_429_length_15801_cov_6.878551_14_plen_68_part_00